jgi:hypothetical protein
MLSFSPMMPLFLNAKQTVSDQMAEGRFFWPSR